MDESHALLGPDVFVHELLACELDDITAACLTRNFALESPKSRRKRIEHIADRTFPEVFYRTAHIHTVHGITKSTGENIQPGNYKAVQDQVDLLTIAE